MRQNELHQVWEIIKPISSDPVSQQKLWEILMKIVENERNLENQCTDTLDQL